MEQRDLIKDQIEQLGKVLGQILSRFLNLSTTGNANTAIEITNQQLKTEADIEPDILFSGDRDTLIKYCREKSLTENHLETLSAYAFEMGKSSIDLCEKETYFHRSILLLDIADDINHTASFLRMQRKREVEEELESQKKN